MLRRIEMSSQGWAWATGVLVVALGLATACSSGSRHEHPAATMSSAAPSISATPASMTPGAPPASHVAPTDGDPAVYAAAITEVQSYLTMEVQHGPYAAAAAYLAANEQAPAGADTTWPAPGADPQDPVLLAGSVSSYEPWSWTSADQFTLSVILDLHFRGDPSRENWNEGHNDQFVTFSRPTPQARWRMYFATGP